MLRVAAVLLLLVTAPRAGDDPVASAVKRGVAWLRSEQKADGSFGSNPGETALALMALRHSGVPAADKACMKAARNLERALPDGTVYGAALGTLALLAQSPERHRKEVGKLVKHLVRGQCRNGQWSYAYRATTRKSAGDNSNTQLAILALAAARARRIEVPKEAFERCHAFFVGSQNEDGGFGYAHNQRKRSYGSMTAGGAMALAVCRPGEPSPAAKRAFAWLAKDFDPAKNRDAAKAFGKKKGKRGDDFWKHYWLWSLERACSVADVGKLGKHDWYGEGAAHLVETQHEKGHWKDPERSVQATSFALLFLARKSKTVITPRAKDRVTTPGDRKKASEEK